MVTWDDLGAKPDGYLIDEAGIVHHFRYWETSDAMQNPWTDCDEFLSPKRLRTYTFAEPPVTCLGCVAYLTGRRIYT